MAAILFSSLVAFLIIGWLWFYIGRPILEDIGIIAVNNIEEAAPNNMSSVGAGASPSLPSSLQTDSRQTADRPALAMPSRDVMLNTCKMLRKHGMSREEARSMLKSMGLPLDNNLWADAAPADDEPIHVTPIVGRPTRAVFETDPDYPYQAPA